MASSGTATLLQDVSDTAIWVAMYRAGESERRDALFRDPHARRLAGERGEQLLSDIPQARRFAWPLVVRTVLFDQLLLERIAAGAEQVVNLAAGLDARPWRMALPPELEWVEIDLPRLLEYKRAVLDGTKPACRVRQRAVDLADAAARRRLIAELAANGRRTLVLSEGLLIYFERGQVAELARDLAAAPQIRWWITDLATPGLLRMMERTWGRVVRQAGAPFRFGPPEGPEFFTPLGWRPARIESTFRAAARLRRLPLLYRLFALFPDPETIRPQAVWSGTVLLERG